MKKLYSKFFAIAGALGIVALGSCSDDEKAVPPPTAEVAVAAVERTGVDFTITSSDASDYAYTIELSDAAAPAAEEIFATGTTGIFEGTTASISANDVEGGANYILYVAVRRVNPFVYSQVYATPLSTDIAYTKLLTMEKIGLTSFTYHLEIPASVTKVKHIAVKKNDYTAISWILSLYGGVSFETYLNVFGHTAEASGNTTLDKYAQTALYDDISIYSGTDYYVMAAPLDENEKVIPAELECIEMTTRKAAEAPYDIDVTVAATSTGATVSITPAEEFESYRVFIESRKEFDGFASEGEAEVRSAIIGLWDDSKNSKQHQYTGATEIKVAGFRPNTDYVVGIVGFDAQCREKVVLHDFTTTEPTGPAPQITLTPDVPTEVAPWSNYAVKVNVANAVELRGGYFTKEAIDRVIANGFTLEQAIANNGDYLGDQAVAAASTPEGLIMEINTLLPETNYVFGVYAVNDEYVASCSTLEFATEAAPQFGGAVREAMPGTYTAKTTCDAAGTTVEFPVTISTGFTSATAAAYKAANRLVGLGFGNTAGYETKTPADLVAEGFSTEYAEANFGPKWFIEFTADDMFFTQARVASDSDPAARYGWNMGVFGSDNTYLFGYAINQTTGRDMNNDNFNYPVTVSEDGNTVTIHGYEYNATRIYYPTMVVLTTSVYSPDKVVFRAYSDIVLTRTAAAQAKGKVLAADKPMPRVVNMAYTETFAASAREAKAQKLK